MTFLVDTNVLAEAVRPRPDPGAAAWLRSQVELQLRAVTVEEVSLGLAWKPHPRVAAALTRLLSQHCTVHPVTVDIAQRAGDLRGRLQATGHTRTQADMLIAATALHHGLTVVTRNERDFLGCGVALFNPFRG